MKNKFTIFCIIFIIFQFLALFSSIVFSNILNQESNLDLSEALKFGRQFLRTKDCNENKNVDSYDLDENNDSKSAILRQKRNILPGDTEYNSNRNDLFFSLSEKIIIGELFEVLSEEKHLELKKYNFTVKSHIEPHTDNNDTEMVFQICPPNVLMSLILPSEMVDNYLSIRTKNSIFWPSIELEQPLKTRYSKNQKYLIINDDLEDKIMYNTRNYRNLTKNLIVKIFIDSLDCKDIENFSNQQKSPIYYDNFCFDMFITNEILFKNRTLASPESRKAIEKYKFGLRRVLILYYLKESKPRFIVNEHDQDEVLIKMISNKFENLYFSEFLKRCMGINGESIENNYLRYGYTLLLCVDEVQKNYIYDVYNMCSQNGFTVPVLFVRNQIENNEEKDKYLAEIAQSRKIIIEPAIKNNFLSIKHIKKYYKKKYFVQIKAISLDLDSETCMNHKGIFIYNSTTSSHKLEIKDSDNSKILLNSDKNKHLDLKIRKKKNLMEEYRLSEKHALRVT